MYIVVISDHKWSTTHKVFKSHRSKISIICAQVPKNRTSCAQVHKLPQSHCGWKPGGHIVFMITYICSLWHCFHDIYMYIYIYILYYTILYYTILYKVSICNPGIATCGSTLSFDRSLYAIFFVKFANQNFPSVRIFVSMKFLFILQAQQSTHTVHYFFVFE